MGAAKYPDFLVIGRGNGGVTIALGDSLAAWITERQTDLDLALWRVGRLWREA